MEPASEILESPALLKGSIEVVERRSTSRRRLRGTVVKRHLARHLHGLLTRAPEWLVSSYLRYAAAWVNVCAGLPRNRFLESCRYVSTLAARRGIHHTPRGLYRRYVDGALVVLETGRRLFRHGPDAMVRRIDFPAEDLRRIVRLAEEHGGVLACVMHNPGAVFSSTSIARVSNMVLIARNSPSIERTRIALEVFETMGVRVLMVRDGNPIELARACLRLLRKKTIVVATVDRIDRHAGRSMVSMFGQPVGFGSWPAKIAAHSKVPIVPVYVHTRRRTLEVEAGPEKLCADVDEGLEHYFRYFEGKVLDDPASWSFLTDRRWRWVLRDAVRGRPDSDGGLVDPEGSSRRRS